MVTVILLAAPGVAGQPGFKEGYQEATMWGPSCIKGG